MFTRHQAEHILIMKYVSWFVALLWSLLKSLWRGLLMLVFSGDASLSLFAVSPGE
ncbi:hypothetical protein ACNKHV_26385 [Shigella flexneri]